MLERVANTKFLGVFIDEDLNWKHHTSQIALKVSRNIGVLNRVKYILSSEILLTLYYSMIHPYFLYCNIVWGGASQIALNSLVCLQKRMLRLISYSMYRAPSSPLFKKFGILKLQDIHKYQVYIFMYKFKHNMLPVSCSNLIHFKVDAERYNFRKENEFVMIKYQTEIRKKGISVLGPTLWNNLQDFVKQSCSVAVFKSRLMRTLTDCY